MGILRVDPETPVEHLKNLNMFTPCSTPVENKLIEMTYMVFARWPSLTWYSSLNSATFAHHLLHWETRPGSSIQAVHVQGQSRFGGTPPGAFLRMFCSTLLAFIGLSILGCYLCGEFKIGIGNDFRSIICWTKGTGSFGITSDSAGSEPKCGCWNLATLSRMSQAEGQRNSCSRSSRRVLALF